MLYNNCITPVLICINLAGFIIIDIIHNIKYYPIRGGAGAWPNGQGLGPCGADLREFEPRPPQSFLSFSKEK